MQYIVRCFTRLGLCFELCFELSNKIVFVLLWGLLPYLLQDNWHLSSVFLDEIVSQLRQTQCGCQPQARVYGGLCQIQTAISLLTRLRPLPPRALCIMHKDVYGGTLMCIGCSMMCIRP